MREGAPKTIRLEDYRPPAFLIDEVDLVFELGAPTTVKSRLTVRRNPEHGDPAAPLVLDGESVELVSLHLDGEALGGEPLRAGRGRADPAGRPRQLRPGRGDPDQAAREHRAVGALRVRWQLHHPVRGRGVSADHLLPRPAGRDGALHHHDRGRTRPAARSCCRTANRVDEGTAGPGRHWAKWVDPWPKPS